MAATKTYTVPPSVDRSQVVDLTPETTHRAAIQPTTRVVCVNRGPKRIIDKYNAHEYDIPPFALFEVEYQAAVHLQRRAIVMGTKNPDPNDPTAPQHVSWISILGLDPEDACLVFSDAELARFGESAEGINRGAMADPGNRNISIVKTNDLRRSLPGTGVATSESAMAASAGTGFPNQAVDGSEEAVERALERVSGSDATQAVESARGSGWVPPGVDELKGEDSAPPPAPAIGRRSGGVKGNRR